MSGEQELLFSRRERTQRRHLTVGGLKAAGILIVFPFIADKQPFLTCWEVYGGRGFPGGASGKEPACQCRSRKRCGFDPWLEDPLEEGTATHRSTLAWRIPWTEERCGLRSIGSQRIGHDWSNLALSVHTGEHGRKMGKIGGVGTGLKEHLAAELPKYSGETVKIQQEAQMGC